MSAALPSFAQGKRLCRLALITGSAHFANEKVGLKPIWLGNCTTNAPRNYSNRSATEGSTLMAFRAGK
jgi:hypothetical protein